MYFNRQICEILSLKFELCRLGLANIFMSLSLEEQ